MSSKVSFKRARVPAVEFAPPFPLKLPKKILEKILGYLVLADYVTTQTARKGFKAVTLARWVEAQGKTVYNQLFHTLILAPNQDWTVKVNTLHACIENTDRKMRAFLDFRTKPLFPNVLFLAATVGQKQKEGTFSTLLKHCPQTQHLCLECLDETHVRVLTKVENVISRLSIQTSAGGAAQTLQWIQTLQKCMPKAGIYVEELCIQKDEDVHALIEIPGRGHVRIWPAQRTHSVFSLVFSDPKIQHAVLLYDQGIPEYPLAFAWLHTLKIEAHEGRFPELEECPHLRELTLVTKDMENRKERLQEIPKMVANLPSLKILDLSECYPDQDKLKQLFAKSHPALKVNA